MMAAGRLTPFLPELPSGARLLVVRLRSLGDALLLTPALRALKQWRADLRVTVAMYERFAPVLEGNPDVDELLVLDPRRQRALLGSLASVRGQGFAACFNLHGNALSAVLTRLSGAPHRVGFRRFRWQRLYTARVDPRAWFGRERLHAAETLIAPFYAAGLPQGEIPPLQLFPRPAVRAPVAQKLARRGVTPGARYAIVHPVANFFTKEWPFERYATLARYLEEQHGLVPVFTCGPGEGRKLDAVAAASGRALVRLDPLTVPELVAAIEGAALFVGTDSGPAHIAAALGRPLVVLFGSSDAEAWSPWRARHARVQNYYSCNPCPGDRCYVFAEPECILSISEAQVRAAVDRMLAAAPVAVG